MLHRWTAVSRWHQLRTQAGPGAQMSVSGPWTPSLHCLSARRRGCYGRAVSHIPYLAASCCVASIVIITAAGCAFLFIAIVFQVLASAAENLQQGERSILYPRCALPCYRQAHTCARARQSCTDGICSAARRVTAYVAPDLVDCGWSCCPSTYYLATNLLGVDRSRSKQKIKEITPSLLSDRLQSALFCMQFTAIHLHHLAIFVARFCTPPSSYY